MFFVYAIRSLHRKYIYVGLTDNPERRIGQHNAGYERTTKPYLPFETVFIFSNKRRGSQKREIS
jgi:putative endonuclease